VRRVQASGIHVLGNFIFGLPDDNRERMQQTLDMAKDLNCEFANFYRAMAYPGSALHTMALQNNIQLPAEWHHYCQHGYEILLFANKHCSPAEILKFRDAAWQTFFTSERYLDSIASKFGPKVLAHVQRMTKMPLRPKLLEEQMVSV